MFALDLKVDQNRTVMGFCLCHSALNLARVFHGESANALGLSELGKIGAENRLTAIVALIK